MPSIHNFKIKAKSPDLFLRVSEGHFATTRCHTNYFIDITMQKTRLSEAKAVADELRRIYSNNTIIDTILCLDGTEVIGTCLAEGLTRDDFVNMNAHQTIYVLSPEYTSDNRLLFRDNTRPMIENKHVLILAASVRTGGTAKSAMEAVEYYKGQTVGIAAIFATETECGGVPVSSVFCAEDLPEVKMYEPGKCPFCKEGRKIDALVNHYGFSKLD